MPCLTNATFIRARNGASEHKTFGEDALLLRSLMTNGAFFLASVDSAFALSFVKHVSEPPGLS